MTAQDDREDQSMEEILQSIKRIIAEEEPEDGAAAAAESASDVLELTDVVNEDGTVSAASPALEEEFMMDQMPAEPAPLPDPEPTKEPEPMQEASLPSDGLASDDAVGASNKALESLLNQKQERPAAMMPTTPSAPFRGGHTVEDLVLEALKPMLKEWLDANLPQTVERLVQEEIKRITPR